MPGVLLPLFGVLGLLGVLGVVGGGVIGCSIAWRLAQSGQRVAIFERGDAGKEASWAAGGMLAPHAYLASVAAVASMTAQA